MCYILKTARLTVSLSFPRLHVSLCLSGRRRVKKLAGFCFFFNASVIGPCDHSVIFSGVLNRPAAC